MDGFSGLASRGLKLDVRVYDGRGQLKLGLREVHKIGGILLDCGGVIDLSNSAAGAPEVERARRRIPKPFAQARCFGQKDGERD
jgi:hypothetical protein